MRVDNNIREIENLGIDWMGFIFHEASPRHVINPPEYMPQRCKRMGVFVNKSREIIMQTARQYGLDGIQLHGEELPDEAHRLREKGYTVVKAIPIATAKDFGKAKAFHGCCDYLLFDTQSNVRGGSGSSFDWSLIDYYTGETPFILSGGITPDMVENIKKLTHPQWIGIDINSGFETSPANKNPQLIANFLNQLNLKI